MKLFNSTNNDVIDYCQWYFDFELLSEMFAIKGAKFEKKFVDHKICIVILVFVRFS